MWYKVCVPALFDIVQTRLVQAELLLIMEDGRYTPENEAQLAVVPDTRNAAKPLPTSTFVSVTGWPLTAA